MVSAALPALTVLTASIERLGQSCASAAGANVMKPAHARAPHDVRNDIATSLEPAEVLARLRWSRFSLVTLGRWAPPPDLGPAVRRHGRMMLPIGARRQPAARSLRSCVARGPPWPRWQGKKCDDWTLRRELRPNEIFGKDGCRKAHGVADGAMVAILGPRGEDEVREREGEYRHAEEECIGDPLHGVFGLTPILRRSHPFAHDVAAQPVVLHVAGSLASSCRAPHRLTGGRD